MNNAPRLFAGGIPWVDKVIWSQEKDKTSEWQRHLQGGFISYWSEDERSQKMIGKTQRLGDEAEALRMPEEDTLEGSPRGSSSSLNI